MNSFLYPFCLIIALSYVNCQPVLNVQPAAIQSCFASVQGSNPPVKLTFYSDPTIPGTNPPINEYNKQRHGCNGRSLDWFPIAIVDVAAITDIQAAVQCARILSVPINVMGGGHSYEVGFATNGLMLWMSNFNSYVNFNFVPNNAWITIQSGVRNARSHGTVMHLQLNATNSPLGHVFGVSSGTYPDVGVSGHAMCGGYGSYGRQLGLLADQIIELTVITADAQITVANAQQNSDLFWALKGGCSSAFGIVAYMKFKLHQFDLFPGLANKPAPYVTHVAFPILPQYEALTIYWVANHGCFLDTRIAMVYNLANRDLVGIFMGDYNTAVATIWNTTEHGLQFLSEQLGFDGLSFFYEKTLTESELKEFNATSAEEMMTITGQTFEGSRYYMLSMVFSISVDMVGAQLLASIFDSRTAKSMAIKARNGWGAQSPIPGQIYTDYAYGPLIRGILYDIHVGVSSPTAGEDWFYINQLNSINDAMAPYHNGNFAYPGYIYLGSQVLPDFFGAANKQQLIAVRQKYDPTNLFSNRVAALLYPVAGDQVVTYAPPSGAPVSYQTLPQQGGAVTQGSANFNQIHYNSSGKYVMSSLAVGLIGVMVVLFIKKN